MAQLACCRPRPRCGPDIRSELRFTEPRDLPIVTGDKLTRWDVQDDTGEPAPIDHAMASGASDPMAISTLTLERQFLDFGDACATGRAPLVSAVEGYRALQAVISIYESCRQGRAVDIDHSALVP